MLALLFCWLAMAAPVDRDAEVQAIYALFEGGDYQGALALAEQTLASWDGVVVPEDPLYFTLVGDLGVLYATMGDVERAEQHVTLALQLESAVRPGSPELASSLVRCAPLYQMFGDTDRAIAMLEEARPYLEAAHGEASQEFGHWALQYGMLMLELGRVERSEPVLEKAERSLRQYRDDGTSAYGQALNSLGQLCRLEGRQLESRAWFEQAIAFFVEYRGADHPETLAVRENLSVLLIDLGDRQTALRMQEQLVEAAIATYGPDHWAVANSLHNLGASQLNQGKFEDAEASLLRAVDLFEKHYGPEHQTLSSSWTMLSRLYRDDGRMVPAQAAAERAVHISRQSKDPNLQDALRQLGLMALREERWEDAQAAFAEAVAHVEGRFGADHVIRPQLLGYLAIALAADGEGDEDQARALVEEAMLQSMDGMSLLDVLSEREAMAAMHEFHSVVDVWLVMHHEETELAWQRLRHMQGAVARRLRVERFPDDPALAALAQELDRVRRLRSQVLQGMRSADLDALTDEQERLERELARQSREVGHVLQADIATTEALCAALPADGALLQYWHNVRDVGTYTAFVMGADCVVHRLDLGPAEPIEQAVERVSDAFGRSDLLESRVSSISTRLTEYIWEPVVSAAPRVRRWWVVPDAGLAGVPLAALQVDGRYVLEDHTVSYLDRPDDLLRTPATGAGAVVVGGVDYGVGDGPACHEALRSLPGTVREAEEVSRRWRRRGGRGLVQLQGLQATPEAVREALVGRSLVHLATHGLFAGEDCASDPMLRSGLALSGANDRGGVLTAADVAGLDLRQTGLVVLSACETGQGQAQRGEGLLGLRRAFTVAGAGALLSSLWAIPDAQTAELMRDFYRHLLRGDTDPATALREAQLERLRQARKRRLEGRPQDWGAFIVAGTPARQ